MGNELFALPVATLDTGADCLKKSILIPRRSDRYFTLTLQ